MVWSIAGVGLGVLDLALGGSVAAGALIMAMVVIGGAVASALSYLAVEWIMRPASRWRFSPTHPCDRCAGDRDAHLSGLGVRDGGRRRRRLVVAIAYLAGAACRHGEWRRR